MSFTISDRWKSILKTIALVFIVALSIIIGRQYIQPEAPEVQPTVITELWVDYFDNVKTQWTRVGSSPYLDAQDQPTNYVYNDNTVAAYQKIGDFFFPDIPSSAVIVKVELWIYAETVSPLVYFSVFLWDGTTWKEYSYYHGAWSWKSQDVTTILDTPDKVNSAKVYFDSGGYGVVIKCDAMYLKVEYTLPFLNSQNIAPPDDYVSTHAETIEFSAYWTSNAYLSHFIFSWNMSGVWTNETYTFPSSVTESWSNITKTLTDDGGVWVEWKFYANNTEGRWNSTATRKLFHWEKRPPAAEHIAGDTVCGGVGSFYYNGTATGGVEAIITVYSNSTYATWKYEIKGFDFSTFTWTPAYVIADAGGDDPHWRPAVAPLPNGSLIVAYAYWDYYVFFRISKYSIKTESNLTKILTNWNPEHKLMGARATLGWTDYFVCYPFFAWWDDTLIMHMRDGRSTDAEWQFWRWREKNTMYSFVSDFDGTILEWSTLGKDPWVHELPYVNHRISISGVNQEIGNFHFRVNQSGYVTEFYGDVEIGIEGKESEVSTALLSIHVFDGASWATFTVDVPGISLEWFTIDVSSHINTLDELKQIQIELEWDSATVVVYIGKVYVSWNGSGFQPAQWLTWNEDAMYVWSRRQRNGRAIFTGMKAYVYDTQMRRADGYWFYTGDKGSTFYNSEGTLLGKVYDLPFYWEDALLVDAPDTVRTHISSYFVDNTIYVIRHQWDFYTNTTTGTIVIGKKTYGTVVSPSFSDFYFENGTSFSERWMKARATHSGWWIEDPYYGRPSIWYINKKMILSKLVGLPPMNHTHYRPVYSVDVSKFIHGGIGNIIDTPGMYEGIGLHFYFMLGEPTAKDYTNQIPKDYAYGCKFTAEKTGKINSVRWFSDPSAIFPEHVWTEAAIYNETGYLLGQSDEAKLYPGETHHWWGPAISFPTPVNVEVGKVYWVFFRHSHDDTDFTISYRFENTTIGVNETAYFYLPWTTEPEFPSTLPTLTYLNQNIMMFGEWSRLIARGLGLDVWPPSCTETGWSGLATIVHNITFYTYCTDNIELDRAEFYWNVTGTMKLNGTYTFTPGTIEGWGNFTRELPDLGKVYTLAWMIRAVDEFDNIGDTGIRTMTVINYTQLTVGWVPVYAWKYDVGKTLGEVNASLNIDNVPWQFIVLMYPNGSRYVFIKDWQLNVNVPVTGTDNILWIWCTGAEEWYHQYP